MRLVRFRGAARRAAVSGAIAVERGRAGNRRRGGRRPLLREAIDEGDCRVARLPPETLSKPTAASVAGGEYSVLNHLSRTSRLKGKRNQHNMTRFHLSKLGAELLGVRGSKRGGNWWAAEERCGPRRDSIAEGRPLDLDCPVFDGSSKAAAAPRTPVAVMSPRAT